MSSTKYAGKRPADISVEELRGRLERAVKRASRSRRFTKVVVLFVSWDYDGPVKKGLEQQDMRFTDDSLELQELLEKKYQYECCRIILPCHKGSSYHQTNRNFRAQQIMIDACHRLRNDCTDEESMIIFHYRGHGTQLDERNEQDVLYLSSGEFFDSYGPREEDPDGTEIPKTTKFRFQDGVSELSRTRADVVFLMDCCLAYRAVFHNTHSVLAAAGPRTAATGGDKGFTVNVTAALNLAFEKQTWLTLGGLHEALLKHVTQGSLAVTPMLAASRKETDLQPSPLFHPVSFPLEDIHLSLKGRLKANGKYLSKRQERVTVVIAAKVKTMDEDMAQRLESALRTLPGEDLDDIKVSVYLGKVASIEEAGSALVTFHIAGCIYHELEDHEAIRYVGILPEMKDERNVLTANEPQILAANEPRALGTIMKSVRKVSGLLSDALDCVIHPRATLAPGSGSYRERRLIAGSIVKENRRPARESERSVNPANVIRGSENVPPTKNLYR